MFFCYVYQNKTQKKDEKEFTIIDDASDSWIYLFSRDS